ncbi:transposase [Parafrankia soli]|uniref:Transposase n=1 Tax=Parafrankia soli TaxID=2599596 RepID=A0A1S1PWN6_9ACTN|nr:IS110 family transposase [Parafrankia soli]OHV27088.1 transposase [Parafrankia soli]
MSITCGIDWAEAHHDICVLDDGGRVLQRRRIDTGAAGFTELMTLLAEHTDDPASVPVAIETDKNLIVVALQAAGLTVFAINPRAVARYRERHGQAGTKSDPGDARVLADILRTDRHQHRPLPSLSDGARAVKALARQHQEAIWAAHQTTSRLRSVLLEFYPQALRAFPNLQHKAALTILAAVPTPDQGLKLIARKVVTLLHRCGRRNDASLVDQIVTALRTTALRQPPPVEAALGQTVVGLLGILTAMHTAVDQLEQALAAEFDAHPLAAVLRSAPGLGPVLAARVLAEIGDDPTRFTTAGGLRAFAGTAPVTRASGRSRRVLARRIRNKRLGDACHWWAFSMLTKSPGARAHYDRRRAAGDRHNAALRNLANKALGRMWWCLQNDQLWDDTAA